MEDGAQMLLGMLTQFSIMSAIMPGCQIWTQAIFEYENSERGPHTLGGVRMLV